MRRDAIAWLDPEGFQRGSDARDLIDEPGVCQHLPVCCLESRRVAGSAHAGFEAREEVGVSRHSTGVPSSPAREAPASAQHDQDTALADDCKLAEEIALQNKFAAGLPSAGLHAPYMASNTDMACPRRKAPYNRLGCHSGWDATHDADADSEHGREGALSTFLGAGQSVLAR